MNTVEPIRDLEKIEKVANVLKRNGSRDYFLFRFGIHSALRISDIIALKVKDVKEKKYVTVVEKKTKKIRRFIISHELKLYIDEYIDGMGDDDYLFPSQKGGHISRVRAWEILKKAGNEVGLENFAPHSLRKTFGYHFYKQTKDIAILQKLFNHSAPSITLRYIGIEQDELDNALRDFTYE